MVYLTCILIKQYRRMTMLLKTLCDVLWKLYIFVYSIAPRVCICFIHMNADAASSTLLLLQINAKSNLLCEVKSASTLTFDTFTVSHVNASGVILHVVESSSTREDDSIASSENYCVTRSGPQTPHSKWGGVRKSKAINVLNGSSNNPLNCAWAVVKTRQMEPAHNNSDENCTCTINATSLQTDSVIFDCSYKIIINISVPDEYVNGINIDINLLKLMNSCLSQVNVSEENYILVSDGSLKNNMYVSIGLTEISKNETNQYANHNLLSQFTLTLPKYLLIPLHNRLHSDFENVTSIAHCILYFQSLFDSVGAFHLHFTSLSFYFSYFEFMTPAFSAERNNTSLRLHVDTQPKAKISLQCLNDVIHLSFSADDYFHSFVVCALCVQWNEPVTETTVLNASNRSFVVSVVTDLEGAWPEFKMSITLHPDVRMSYDVHLISSREYYTIFIRDPECSLQSKSQLGVEEHSSLFNYHFFNGKCYTYHHPVTAINWETAKASCQNRGGNLVMPKSPADRDAIRILYKYNNITNFVFTGLQKMSVDCKEHSLYTQLWIWDDNTVAYNVNISGTGSFYDSWIYCSSVYHDQDQLISSSQICLMAFDYDVICEAQGNANKSLSKASVRFPSLAYVNINLNAARNTLVLCKEGHITHDFLSCHVENLPGETEPSRWFQVFHEDFLEKKLTPSSTPSHNNSSFSLTEMFDCKGGEKTLHYTLVCDFKPDCDDGSDEDFCRHYPQCPEHTCQSGQCIRFDQVCDYVEQCWDKSDELSCKARYLLKKRGNIVNAVLPPSVINFDASGNILHATFNPVHPCPATHFRCHGDMGNCLPVFVRCNGIYDCPDHGDEDDCGQFSCPGFYRCYNSSICLHVDHLCDGLAQCQYLDDEVLCDFQCPEECQCQGLAFICRQPFKIEAYPDVRYLDADSSGMSLHNVNRNVYLVWLRLRNCNISDVIEILNPNLQVLDLSKNRITSVDMDLFNKLFYLVELNLAENPIVQLRHTSQNKLEHSSLKRLDLSHTAIRVFDSIALKSFPHITFLNLSFGILETIGHSEFLYLPNLKIIDIRGNSLEVFSQNLFKRLQNLERIFASNFKLCCKAMLPEIFDENACFAPLDGISSCEDLLRSNFYRVFNWIMASMTIVGNAGSFMFLTLCNRGKSLSGYKLLVINLSLADSLMGVYLSIVGVVDHLFLGNYFASDFSWRNSVACIVSGFLSLLSLEVSSITILLITLDRFIALCFPFRTFAYRRNSIAVACGIAWVVGILLAAIPLMPMTSHWKFYTQTGICVPLPFTGKKYPGLTYSYSLVIIFNIVLLVLIAMGQLFIYVSVEYNSISSITNKKSKSGTIAQRLSVVVISNFLCLFPLGIVAFVSSTGFAVPSEVMVALVIFILPLNAALNPFVYTFITLANRRQKAHELKLIQLLENRFELEAKQKFTEECSKMEEIQKTHDSPQKDALCFISDHLANHEITLTSVLSRLENCHSKRGIII